MNITIIGNRWNDSNGNTYHRATILRDGIVIHKTARAYGYGDSYLDSAAEYLEEAAIISPITRSDNGSKPSLWRVLEGRAIGLEYWANDVNRKKDL
jgi:hypothetical protein